ncbi:MAG: hypothetical protein PW734_02690 [Verrucomicrobium sp.]|nr:hypothetical protein [Verrucomicrobium sp.]
MRPLSPTPRTDAARAKEAATLAKSPLYRKLDHLFQLAATAPAALRARRRTAKKRTG